ncbi:MAG: hypothetical protein IJC07_05755 [Clostridia bacterium]|nr:hypothetical protein [Clostridia bacterium]
MFESLPSLIISIDNDYQSIHFFSIDKKEKKVSHSVEFYKSEAFSEDFFEMLKNVVKLHAGKKGGKAVLLLPDRVFFTDTVIVPSVQKAINASLNLAVETLYKNYNDLSINFSPLFQNKKTTSFALVGVRKEILNKTVKAIEQGGIAIGGVTFYSNAIVNGAISVNPKLKNATCVLADVQPHRTCLCLMVGGKTVGFYALPFGVDVLSEDAVNVEGDLFEHSSAELLVLNAIERARRKRLTVAEDDETEGEEDKSKQGKKAYRLPKSMLANPVTPEEFVYENLCTIAKWITEFAIANKEYVPDGQFENVYINIPEKYHEAVEKLNGDGNLKFTALEGEADSLKNLGLIGGQFIKKFNKTNNF